MSEHQGLEAQYNGVTVADRTVRQLGVELANTHIALATVTSMREEVREASTHINFELWEEIRAQPDPDAVPVENQVVEGAHVLPAAALPLASYLVPAYQADAVARLISLIQRM
jgi:hypothetical protein